MMSIKHSYSSSKIVVEVVGTGAGGVGTGAGGVGVRVVIAAVIGEEEQ